MTREPRQEREPASEPEVRPAPSLRFPSRLHLRLVVTIVAMVGLASGLLAIGSSAFVARQRYDTFVERARQQARLVFVLAQGQSSADQLDTLIAVSRERNGFETMVVSDRVVASRSGLTPDDLPPAVRDASGERFAAAFATVDGNPCYVIGADVIGTERTRLYLVFSERSIRDDLAELRGVLLSAWVIVVIASAGIADLVARRTLAPVRESAQAARALAEGLLHTRLARRRDDEFGTLARAFNEMAEALGTKISELSEAHQRERQFTADVAHDLRTPLAAMVSAASVLNGRMDEVPAAVRRPVELLVADVHRLWKLVEDLLELGSLDASDVVLRDDEVHLPSLCEHLLSVIAPDQPSMRSQAEDVAVVIDRVRVERVLENLLRNALLHGGGSAMLRMGVDDGRLIAVVEDDGPGVAEDALPSIFDRFRKLESSRSTQGSGLGLSIAARHAEVLGGSLSVSNRPSGGAAFRLDVPVRAVERP